MKKYWQRLSMASKLRMVILLSLIAGGLGTSLVALTQQPDWPGFALNLGAELIGSFITFALIDILIGSIEKQEETRWQTQRDAEAKSLQKHIADELQTQLRTYIQGQAVSRLRASDSLENRQAIVDEMRINDLLFGANMRELALQNVDFRNADLSSADLSYTNLRYASFVGANLKGANLKQADLGYANLSEADLRDARLQGAKLINAELLETNLESAYLREAALENANLVRANVRSVDFSRANLKGLNIKSAFALAVVSRLRGATMPDGSRYDGRFNLSNDLQYEKSEDEQELAKFYGVTVEKYLEGQKQTVGIRPEPA